MKPINLHLKRMLKNEYYGLQCCMEGLSMKNNITRKYLATCYDQSLTIFLNSPDAISVEEIGVVFLCKCFIAAKRQINAYLRTVRRPSNGKLVISKVNAVTSASMIAIFRCLTACINRR